MTEAETKLDHHGDCPKCGESWDKGRIWKVWRALKDSEYYQSKTDEELQAMEKEGYSKPYHFSNLIGIEDPKVYDGVSWWQCPYCDARWDRWTSKFLGIKKLK